MSCRGMAAGGQPGPWLMATGAISSWRRRWSVAGAPRAGFPLATSGPSRGVRQQGLTRHKRGDDAVAPIQRGDAPRLPPRRAAAQPAPG